MRGLIGQKLGMTRLFDKTGKRVIATIIQAGPCYVTEIRTNEKNGYGAIQLAFGTKREKVTTKPLQGHFKRAGIAPQRILKEFQFSDLQSEFKLGDAIKADIFDEGDRVTITGISKGKGFAGTVKRHHFSGGPKTHGQSDRHRAPGSLGQSSYPSRVYKGLKMAGRMGAEKVSIRNLTVIKVDSQKNLLLVKGAIPGHNNAYVFVTKQTSK